jgi:VIT1/CCC1 family predicted Fe2+/Mn2+ transporter
MTDSPTGGITFGLASGVITAMGLMVGLYSGTHLKLVVVGGIICMAIADACSDSFGMHVSEEAKHHPIHKDIWASTVRTFVSEFLTELTFLVPVLIFKLSTAVLVGVGWGLSLLAVLSYRIARSQGRNPFIVVGEHLLMALLVVAATRFAGDWVSHIVK